jgi:hypothetical protein
LKRTRAARDRGMNPGDQGWNSWPGKGGRSGFGRGKIGIAAITLYNGRIAPSQESCEAARIRIPPGDMLRPGALALLNSPGARVDDMLQLWFHRLLFHGDRWRGHLRSDGAQVSWRGRSRSGGFAIGKLIAVQWARDRDRDPVGPRSG